MKTREEIFELIEEENVEFIRLQFTDILGNLRNIAVTQSQMGRVLDNQYSFAGAGLVDGNAGIDEELYLKPDLDSFVILPLTTRLFAIPSIIRFILSNFFPLSFENEQIFLFH